MILKSYCRYSHEIQPVEVEISFVPGLPQIQFLGLPDAIIKESEMRIRSALRHQGFNLPSGQRVLVHLRPNHERKSSRGLDLAVAAGILWHTGQVLPQQALNSTPELYGELSLTGEVHVPDDLEDLVSKPNFPLYTGIPDRPYEFDLLGLRTLQDLASPQPIKASPTPSSFSPPEIRQIHFTKEVARLLAVVALGEHPLLIAGPAGTGKSTVAQSIHPLLNDPDPRTFQKARQIARSFGDSLKWRPLVAPHHSTTSLGMIGGGQPIVPGEITRAHGGLLLLDEFLEFSPQVQEALREPVEAGRITIRRAGHLENLPAEVILVATTNLCPCGDYVPTQTHRCRCQLNRRRRYLERLSGPILDRFHIVALSHTWQNPTQATQKLTSLSEIKSHVDSIRQRLRMEGLANTPHTHTDLACLEKQLDSFTLKNLIPNCNQSRRRYIALLKVAHTLALLDHESTIQLSHLEEASQLTIYPVLSLKGELF